MVVVKFAKKLPVEFATRLVGVVTIVFPSNVIVIDEFESKFEPVTDTSVPSGPLVGVTAMLDGITLKVAEE